MILLPAIDLHEGRCVRLFQGQYETAEVVAADALETAREFREAGAHWLHMVDLDGAKEGAPRNREIILEVAQNTDLQVEVGGGIRTLETVADYLDHGVSRVILGSIALKDPELVAAAVRKYGKRIAVGIDARDGKAAAEGWLETSQRDYIQLAKEMEALGVQYLICTDISKDGAMAGPNLPMLDRLNRAVSCNVIASGGVSSLLDLAALGELGLYGAIAGKSIYNGALDLKQAISACHKISPQRAKNAAALGDELDRYFQKSDLVPAIIQEAGTGEVLMLAYMNRESLAKTLETGQTWFYSRSRQELWHKGETSGHFQDVVEAYADCDDDTLLFKVRQTGAACHTGHHSCFFRKITGEGENK